MKNENGLGRFIGEFGKVIAKLSLNHQADRNKEQSARLLADPEIFSEIDELHKSLIPKLSPYEDVRTYPVTHDDLEVILSDSRWLSRQPGKTRRRIDSVVKRFLIKHGVGSYAYDWLESLILYQKPVISYPAFNFDLLHDVMDDKISHVTFTSDEKKLISNYAKERLGFKTRPLKKYQNFWRQLSDRLDTLSNHERRKPTLKNLKRLAQHGKLTSSAKSGADDVSEYKRTYMDIATTPESDSTSEVKKIANVLKTQNSRIRRKYGLREISPKLVSRLLKWSSLSFGYRNNPNEKQLHKKTRARNSKSI